MWCSSGQVVMAAGRAAPLIAAESPDPVALSVRAAVPRGRHGTRDPPPRQGTRLEKVAGAGFKVAARRRSPGKRRHRVIPRRTAAESGR